MIFSGRKQKSATERNAFLVEADKVKSDRQQLMKQKTFEQGNKKRKDFSFTKTKQKKKDSNTPIFTLSTMKTSSPLTSTSRSQETSIPQIKKDQNPTSNQDSLWQLILENSNFLALFES